MSHSYRARSNTRRAFARLAPAGECAAMTTRDKLRQAKRDHDALEESCKDLAAIKYKITLLKADSESFIRQDGGRGSRCTSGIPDRLCAIPPTGRFVGFEFKIGKAKARKNQREIHQMLIAHGAAVYVIRSMSQFDHIMHELVAEEKYRQFCQEIGRVASAAVAADAL